MESDLYKIKEMLQAFAKERDWDEHHKPKDLLIALVGEVGELAECYCWLSEDELCEIHKSPEKLESIEDEIADVMIYSMILAYKSGIDLPKAIHRKMRKNAEKYPAKACQALHSNVIQGFKQTQS